MSNIALTLSLQFLALVLGIFLYVYIAKNEMSKIYRAIAGTVVVISLFILVFTALHGHGHMGHGYSQGGAAYHGMGHGGGYGVHCGPGCYAHGRGGYHGGGYHHGGGDHHGMGEHHGDMDHDRTERKKERREKMDERKKERMERKEMREKEREGEES